MASGRPAFGSRFNTGNIEPALLARGFHYGSAPNSVVIGWNSGHAAVTLPDGTPVSSGESGAGVRIGGGGAYQPQFSRHMYLPVEAQEMNVAPPAEQGPPPPVDPAAVAAPDAPVAVPAPDAPAPADGPAPDVPVAAPEAPADLAAGNPAPAEGAPVADGAPAALPEQLPPPAEPAPGAEVIAQIPL